jgi:Tol biopolymer transport system component
MVALVRVLVSLVLLGTLLPRPAAAQSAPAAATPPHAMPLADAREEEVERPAGPQGPPPNLRAGAFLPLVERMWQVSPRFRRQCARLAAAPALTVTVRAESMRVRSDIRAFTRMRREKGTLVAADINLLVVADAVELIAHEVEHVIEQLDGAEPQHDACGRRTGAVETCRAVEVGRQVAREVEQAGRRRVLRVPQRETLRVPADPPGAHVSANGRFVAFISAARLVTDAGRGRQLYVLDLQTGEVHLESRRPGWPERLSGFTTPRLSGDGTLMVFSVAALDDTSATVLGLEVAVLHRRTGTVRVLAVEADAGSTRRHTRTPAISADGRTVVFESTPRPRGPGERPITGIYLVRLASGAVEQVSVPASTGAKRAGPLADSMTPAISADGRFVAFASTADLTCDTAAACAGQPVTRRTHSNIYLRDTHAGLTMRITSSADGGEPNGPSSWPSISADGRYIAFASEASNLVDGDRNRASDVFVHDRLTGTTELVSRRPDGRPADGPSRFPAISGDGGSVAFQSLASDLLCAKRCAPRDRDINLVWDVYLADRRSGVMVRAGADDGDEWMAPSSPPSIDDAGRVLVFSSREPIDEHDLDHDDDLYIWLLPS